MLRNVPTLVAESYLECVRNFLPCEFPRWAGVRSRLFAGVQRSRGRAEGQDANVGETLCPALVSVSTTAWAEIVSGTGTYGTLVVAEDAFFLSAMCPIYLIWGRSSYKMTRPYGTHWCHAPVPLRGRAEGGGGATATLGRPNGGIPGKGFGTTVVGGPAAGVLADCAFRTICRD